MGQRAGHSPPRPPAGLSRSGCSSTADRCRCCTGELRTAAHRPPSYNTDPTVRPRQLTVQSCKVVRLALAWPDREDYSEKTQKSKRARTRLVACVQISCRLSCKFSCPQRSLLLWSLASGQLATPGWLAVNSNRGGNRKAETVTKPLMVAPRPPANTSSSGGRHHTRPAE